MLVKIWNFVKSFVAAAETFVFYANCARVSRIAVGCWDGGEKDACRKEPCSKHVGIGMGWLQFKIKWNIEWTCFGLGWVWIGGLNGLMLDGGIQFKIIG